jgi:hypothetical protein
MSIVKNKQFIETELFGKPKGSQAGITIKNAHANHPLPTALSPINPILNQNARSFV